jgi:hypothetical protein
MSLVEKIPESEADREWLAERNREAARIHVEREAQLNSPILTVRDAMLLVQVDSTSAWARWAAKWGIKPCDKGRYARHDVMNALEIESGARGNMERNRRLSRARSAKEPRVGLPAGSRAAVGG